MPRVLMMRRTKYTLPEYDDEIHALLPNDMDGRNYYRDSLTDYPNEYKDNNEGAYDMGHPNHPHSSGN